VVYSAVDRKPTHFTGNIGANTGQYSFMGHNAGNTKLLGYISLKIKVISLKIWGLHTYIYTLPGSHAENALSF